MKLEMTDASPEAIAALGEAVDILIKLKDAGIDADISVIGNIASVTHVRDASVQTVTQVMIDGSTREYEVPDAKSWEARA